jgi:hypothetical protein
LIGFFSPFGANDQTFLTGTNEERSGTAAVAAPSSGASALPKASNLLFEGYHPSAAVPSENAVQDAEKLLSNWSHTLVEFCVEDWDLQKNIVKMEVAAQHIEKINTERIEAHRAYMQELQSLRDRLVKLERGTPIEFVIPAGDVTFYEPTKALDEELKTLVKEIVEYLVRKELAANKGMMDKTEELMGTIKEKDDEIEELQTRLSELQAELDGERRKNEEKVSSPKTNRRESQNEPSKAAQPTMQSRRQLQQEQENVCGKCGGPMVGDSAEAAELAKQLQEAQMKLQQLQSKLEELQK